MAGLAFLFLLFLLSIGGPLVTPYDPYEPDMQALLVAPSAKHWMGTDQIGRDMLSRIIAGTGYSLSMALTATAVATVVGIPIGLVAGYWSGAVRALIDLLTDAMLAFPGLLLALALVTAFGPGYLNGMVALGIAFSPMYIRLVRGQALSARENLYVEASRALGGSRLYILMRHILPNISSPIIVLSSMAVGGALLAGSGLSYLGLGAQPPIPEWGALMNAGIWFFSVAPWITLFPGLAIMVTVLAANLLGDGLRDILDPHETMRRSGLDWR